MSENQFNVSRFAKAVPTDNNLSKPLAVSVREFCRLSSLGRSTAFKLINEGRLEVIRIGGRTLVLTRSIDELLIASD